MASECISFLIEPIKAFVIEKLKQEFQYVTEHEKYFSTLQKEIELLWRRREDVEKEVAKATRELKETGTEVSGWLEKVQGVENEWVTLGGDIMNTSNGCFRGLCPNLSSRRKISKRVSKMTLQVEDLRNSGNFTVISHDLPPPDVIPLCPSDTVKNIISRELIMQDVMEALQDGNIQSIGVYGMGGIGKTTLVKNINDEMRVKHYFRKVIMVVVSKDPDIKLIQQSIAERLGLELKGNDLDTRAFVLYERLKQEESVLIILDDMWDIINVDELGLRHGSLKKNCKFILTTRNLHVCKRMKVHKTVEMSPLSEEESWILFEQKAGTAVGISKFQHTAREIVRRCKGSPLAISVLGSRLGVQEEEFIWEHALAVLQNPNAVGLKGIMPEVVTSLTWSYERLSSPDVQLCFLYCCLFPEDYNIRLVDLRNYGIGEKFVQMTNTLEQASNELHHHVKILQECGLLLAGDRGESVKMHDVVRDVAIYIADRDQRGFLVNVDGESRCLSRSEKLSTCKRISLAYSENEVLSDPLECPQLKSLLMRGTGDWLAKPDDLLEETPALAVLDLQAKCSRVEDSLMRVPRSVSCLKKVVTLYLQGCNMFKQFSVLRELRRLEILSLRYCWIDELDEEFGNLTNLKFLDLSYSEINYVAPNVFSKLTRIEELYVTKVSSTWGEETLPDNMLYARVIEVATLPRLCHLKAEIWMEEESHPDWFKNVKQFDIDINGEFEEKSIVQEEKDQNNSARIVGQNMEKRHWVSNLLANAKRNIDLILEECSGFKRVTDLGADGGLNLIEYLELDSCADLEEVIAANESNTVRKLYLYHLERLEKLLHGVTGSGKLLEQLRNIDIRFCPKLTIIFPYNLLVPGEGLGSLRSVTVYACHAVEHVFSTEDDEMAIESSGASLARKSLLTGVTKISIWGLPKLKSIWKGVVPAGSLHSLTLLEVRDCSLEYLLSSDMVVSIQNIEDITVNSEGQENGNMSLIPYSPPSPTFQSLRTLTIKSCPKLKFLFSFAVAKHFNQLHTLCIEDCSGLRCVIGSIEEEHGLDEHNGLLPALRDITMKKVWRLTSFFKGDSPITSPLEAIDLKWCPNLKRFPLQNVSSIKTFLRQDEWYRRLDEEDQSRLSIFQPSSRKQDGVSELDILHSAVAGLWSDHNASQLEGITQIQQFLVKSKPEHVSDEVFDMISLAVVPRSIEFLTRDDFPQLQSETAWMLASLAYRDNRISSTFNGVVPILVKLRSSPHEDIREKVALALGNINFRFWFFTEHPFLDWVVHILVKLLYSHDEDIGAMAASALGTTAGVSIECRDIVLGHGGLTALLTQLDGHSEKSRAATLAVCRFFEDEPCMPLEQMKLALPALKSLVHSRDETICASACKALEMIARDTAEGIQAVIETGVCPRLVELLQHPSPSVVIAPLGTIQNITCGDDLQVQCILDHQALPCLLNLLTHDHKESIKVAACWTISNIVSNNNVVHIQAVIRASIIGPLVQQLEMADLGFFEKHDIRKVVASAIRNASRCQTQEVIQYLVNQGCIKKLCDLLDCPDSSIVLTCLQGLHNILCVGLTSSTGDRKAYFQLVHDCGGLKETLNLLSHKDTKIQELAIILTGNAAGALLEYRDLVLGHGVLIPLLSHLKDDNEVSILRRLFALEPYPSFDQMKPALPNLQRLVHSNDVDVCSSACFALSCVCGDGTIDEMQNFLFIDPAIYPRLVKLLQHSSPSVVFAALHAVANIVCCRKVQSQCFIDHQALPYLLSLLTGDHMEHIKQEACIAVKNIMHAGERQVQAVIDAGIIGPLVHQLDSFESCKGVVACALLPATESCNQKHIKYLVDQGCIKRLCDLLDSTDSSIISACLDGLGNILMVGGMGDTRDALSVNSYALLVDESEGFKKITGLQVHKDTDIQEKAASIVKTYKLVKEASLPSDTPLASFPIASGVFDTATTSSPLQEDAPPGLVEDLEGEGGNIHAHGNTETQVEVVGLVGDSRLHDDSFTSFGLEKNELPILSNIPDLAFGSSSSYRKPPQHLYSHDENIRAMAPSALGTTAGVSAECRDVVLAHGGLTTLLSQLDGPLEQMKLALPALKSLVHSKDETICASACNALERIAGDTTEGIQAIIETGVCTRLVELLQHPFPSVVIASLKTIQNIVWGGDVQAQCILDHQALPCLLKLLTHDHMESIKVAACWTISNIMRNNNVVHTQAVIGANIIGPLVQQLEREKLTIGGAAAYAIRNASGCQSQEVIQYLVNQGCIKSLCDLLDCPDSRIVLSCLRGLHNILYVGLTSSTGDGKAYVQQFHDCGGLKKTMSLLSHKDTEIQESAIIITGNVAGAFLEYRDLVLGHGALIPLLSHLNYHAEVSILRCSTKAILRLFAFKPYPSFDEMKPALPDLQRLVHSDDEVVCSYVCYVLACICEGGTTGEIQDFFDPAIYPRLVELLQHPSPSVVLAALYAVANIVHCRKVQSQCFIYHQALPCLLSLLTDDYTEKIKQTTCLAVNNIMDAGEDQVQAVIDAGIIGPLLHQLDSFESCTDAIALTIFTATESGNKEHIKYIVNQGCIKKLCDLLDSSDSGTITDCLDGLGNILMAGGMGDTRGAESVNSYALLVDESEGFKKIVGLQGHSDTEIQEKAANIVKTYQLEKEASLPSDTPLATFPIASGVFGTATSSSPLQEDGPPGLVEDLEGEGGNIHVHDNTETQVKVVGLVGDSQLHDDSFTRYSFGLEKNELPILSDISDLAFGSSSSYRKPPQDLEGDGGNKLVHDNTESETQVDAVGFAGTFQLEDDSIPTDSFGLEKNEFPIFSDISDFAFSSSSFYNKPSQDRERIGGNKIVNDTTEIQVEVAGLIGTSRLGDDSLPTDSFDLEKNEFAVLSDKSDFSSSSSLCSKTPQV